MEVSRLWLWVPTSSSAFVDEPFPRIPRSILKAIGYRWGTSGVLETHNHLISDLRVSERFSFFQVLEEQLAVDILKSHELSPHSLAATADLPHFRGFWVILTLWGRVARNLTLTFLSFCLKMASLLDVFVFLYIYFSMFFTFFHVFCKRMMSCFFCISRRKRPRRGAWRVSRCLPRRDWLESYWAPWGSLVHEKCRTEAEDLFGCGWKPLLKPSEKHRPRIDFYDFCCVSFEGPKIWRWKNRTFS